MLPALAADVNRNGAIIHDSAPARLAFPRRSFFICIEFISFFR
jgi:hypothetical protein